MSQRSRHVPYRQNESWQQRHERRLQFNVGREEAVRAWAQRHGIQLVISNHGHHWRFKRGRRTAEWWPSSARLVLQRDYQKDHHVHDHEQAMKILEPHLVQEDPHGE